MRYFYVWAASMGAMATLTAEIQHWNGAWQMGSAVLFMILSLIALREFDKADRSRRD